MNFIDVHTHAFPDQLAPHAISTLQQHADWKAVSGGTVSELTDSMDQAGIAASVLCQIATKPSQADNILKWSDKIRSERIIPFPSVHPDTPDIGGWVNRIADEGYKGLKFHPFYQGFDADDEKMYRAYEAAGERGLVVTLHCGYDVAFPMDMQNASPERLAKVTQKFPDMKLICTHLGGWKDWDNVEKFLVGSGVYLETSFSLMFLSSVQARRIIEKHGTDKILFGTDWPWCGQSQGIGQIRQLGFDQKTAGDILGNNARGLLNI